MIQNLSSYHLVQSSYRAGGFSGQVSGIGNLPPAQLLGVVFPRAFGRGVAQTGYWGAWTFEETYIYIGLLPLLFAPAALLKPRRWHAVFFLGVGAASLLLCLGNQGLLWPILRLIPGFNVLKGSSRFILTFNLAVLILGGIGFDRWRSGEFPSRLRHTLTRFWLVVSASLGGLIVLLALLYRFDPLGFRDFAAAVLRPFLSGVKHASQDLLGGIYTYFSSFRLEYLIPLVILVFFLVLIRGGPERRRPKRLSVALVVIVAVADVLIFATLVIQPVPRAQVDHRPEVIDVLEESSSGERVALVKEPSVKRGEFPLCSNQLLPYQLEDAFGFSTIPPMRLDRFLGYLNNVSSDPALELLGVGMLYTNLVPIGNMPYDLSAPYRIPVGLGVNSYAYPVVPGSRELRFLLDGTILDHTASGRILIKLISISQGRKRDHPSLLLDKDKRSGDFLLELIDGESPASLQLREFKSQGYEMGRSALEVRLPLEGLDEVDELMVMTACDKGLEGTRLAALGVIDGLGQGIPLAPWPRLYSDDMYAVYELEDALPRAFSVSKVTWTDDWREAVDLTRYEWDDPREVILVEEEVDSQTRAAIDYLHHSGQETHIELEEDGAGLTLRTSGSEDTVLVTTIDYLPGWTAYIDGEETSLFSAYGFLTAMYLPAGEHTVELTYRPPGLTAGMSISAVALAFLLGLYMFFRIREKRAAEVGSVPESTLPPPDSGSISAFFPCYNDSATLGELIEKALGVLASLTDDYEVIIVDDGSTDNSSAVIDMLAARYSTVRVVRHERNHGYGAALRSGIKASSKDWIFYSDSDGQYDVEDLRRLHALSGKADVVNGYKENRSDPWYRLCLGATYNYLIRRVFAILIRDVDCDFRLMRGHMVRGLDLRSEGGAICVELVKGLQAAGVTFAETAVGHYPREVGKSQFFRLKNLVVMSRELASLWWRLSKRGEV